MKRLALVVALALVLAPPPAWAADSLADDGELWLLEVRLEREALVADMQAYRRGGRLFVPIGALARELELALEVDASRGTVTGELPPGGRRFEVDAVRGEVRLDGRAATVPPGALAVLDDDVYVDAALLDAWWPVKISPDMLSSRLDLEAETELPVQVRWARERQTVTRRVTQVDPGYPRLTNPYRLWDGPYLDPTVSLTWRPAPEVPGGFRPGLRYGVAGSANLMYLNATTYLSGEDGVPLRDLRLLFGRRELEPVLFGPLGGREMAFGDVLVPGLPHLASADLQRGLLLSNYPIDQQNQTDRHTFRGDLAPGWDVELFHNDVPMGYEQARNDGQYVFEDVPLLLGRNVFRLVFRGPQGQQHEEVRTYSFADALPAPGQAYYRAAGTFTRDGDARGLARADVGLGPRMAAGGGVASIPGVVRRDYGLASLRGLWDQVYVHTDVAGSQDGGLAGELGGRTQIGPVALQVSRSAYNGFSSELVSRLLSGRGYARADLPTPRSWSPFGGRQATELVVEDFVDGQSKRRLSEQLGFVYGPWSLGGQVAWSDAPGLPVTWPYEDATVQLAMPFWRYRLRGQVTFAPGQLRRGAITTDGELGGGLRAAVGLNAAFDGWSTFVEARKDLGSVMAATRATWDATMGATVGFTISAGLGLDTRRGLWMPDAEPLAVRGAATISVFLDKDLDARQGPDEPPLAGVKVVTGGGQQAITGPDGVAFLTGLAPFVPVDISLSTDSLEDPLWSPRLPGVRVVPQPGKTASVAFPVIAAGEIAGTVRIRRGGVLREASGLAIELLDGTGQVVASTRTAFDGFYTLLGVAPGKYRLRLTADQPAAKRLKAGATRDAVIPEGGGFVDDLDWVIEAAP